jgi:hypothetical protein
MDAMPSIHGGMQCDLRIHWLGGQPGQNFKELFALDHFKPKANWTY